jgi:D-arabinose 1-dehydrogenase-like Zn-dependent alcohol dehydrogenase
MAEKRSWLKIRDDGLRGIPTDSRGTLRFAELTAVRPMIETYPLEKAAEAFAQMMSGKAEFRVVLTALSPSLSLLRLR